MNVLWVTPQTMRPSSVTGFRTTTRSLCWGAAASASATCCCLVQCKWGTTTSPTIATGGDYSVTDSHLDYVYSASRAVCLQILQLFGLQKLVQCLRRSRNPNLLQSISVVSLCMGPPPSSPKTYLLFGFPFEDRFIIIICSLSHPSHPLCGCENTTATSYFRKSLFLSQTNGELSSLERQMWKLRSTNNERLFTHHTYTKTHHTNKWTNKLSVSLGSESNGK